MVWGVWNGIILGLGEVRQFHTPVREFRVLYDLFEAGDVMNQRIPHTIARSSLDEVGGQRS